MPTFDHQHLLHFAEAVLQAAGVAEDDARLVAGLLHRADLRGYPGHGVGHLDSYVERIRNGLIRLDGRPEIVREGKSTAVVDGHFYIGQVVAHFAMQLAVSKAGEHGVGVVSVRHSGHVGRLADFVEMASDQGMIGMAATSLGGGNIAPYGGMEPIAGTNPIAFGFPGRGGQRITIDLATASLSMGELQRMVARKEPVPEGIMLDGSGAPTTDYRAFIGPPRGVMLPFGGHKGSAIHIAVEILGGLLSGNGLGRDWLDKGASAINGAFFQAISVEEFLPLDEFLDMMDELVEWIRSRRPAPGFDAVRIPGDGSRERTAQHLRDGVEIDETAWGHLVKTAQDLDVDLPTPIAG